jgi:hypothetical protein
MCASKKFASGMPSHANFIPMTAAKTRDAINAYVINLFDYHLINIAKQS